MFSYYTPEYAENPPSTGMTTPFTNPEARESTKYKSVPINSSGVPNFSIEVVLIILCERGVNSPSLVNNKL